MPKLSKTGYRKNSKDRNEPSLIIPGSQISMNNVLHPVFGMSNNGHQQMMYPGQNYNFPGANYVHETPIKHMNKLKKSSITINPSKKGTFIAAATRHNMGIQQFAEHVLAHKGDYSPQLRKKANFAKNFAKKMGGGLDRADDYGSSKDPYPGVSSSDFAGPHRSYPIPSQADAIDALRLAHLHGASDVIAKVHAKYPQLKQMGGGISPGYISQTGGYKKLSQSDLLQNWNMNPQTKGMPFRSEFEQTNDSSGKPYFNYYLYHDSPAAKKVAANNSSGAQKQFPQIADPMKQIGYNGVLAPQSFQQGGDSGGVGGLLSNPLVQMAAPIAANIFFPGSGPLVGMAMKALAPKPQAAAPAQGTAPAKTSAPAQSSGGMDIGGLLNMFGGEEGLASMLQKGGEKFVKNYSAQQGQSMDDYLVAQNNDFLNYIAGTTQNAILREEANSFQKQMGGEGDPSSMNESWYPDLAYSGQQSEGTPEPTPPSNFYSSGPFGPYGLSPLPSYVSKNPQNNSLDMQQYVPVDTNQGQNVVSALDNQQIADNTPKPQNPLGGMGGMGGGDQGGVLDILNWYNGIYDEQEALKKKHWLQNQMTIENQVPKDYGSRGDYDVNSGAFRPDNTTSTMQMGGGLKLSNKQVIDMADGLAGKHTRFGLSDYNSLSATDKVRVDNIMKLKNGYSIKDVPFAKQEVPIPKGLNPLGLPPLPLGKVEDAADSSDYLMGYNRGYHNDSPLLSFGVYGRGIMEGARNAKTNKKQLGGSKKTYKKGGTYDGLSHDDVSGLLRDGYQIEFVD